MTLESEFVKQIRIPIHGYVGVTKEELRIIELPVFQRLRDISQLSFVDRVYPDAVHKRFSHSLGVMHLCGKYGERFQKLGAFPFDENDIQLFRLAGLLHDIGHGPFSHAFEHAMGRYVLPKVGDEKGWRGAHIRFGQRVIWEKEYGLWEKLGETRAKPISDLIAGKPAGFPQPVVDAITGLFSADRLDYLFRDAYHAFTIEYGMIDIERVINSLVIDGEKSLYLEKGRHALEGVIFAYYYMYRALYYHHTARAAFVLFLRVIDEAFRHGIISPDEMLRPDKYVKFTDGESLSKILNYENNQGCPLNREKTKQVKNLAFRLLRRDLPKCVITEADFIGHIDEKTSIEQQAESYEGKRKLEEKVREISGHDILIDTPLFVPYPLPLPLLRGGEEEPTIVVNFNSPSQKTYPFSYFAPHLKGLWEAAGIIPRVYEFLDEKETSAYSQDKDGFRSKRVGKLMPILKQACQELASEQLKKEEH